MRMCNRLRLSIFERSNSGVARRTSVRVFATDLLVVVCVFVFVAGPVVVSRSVVLALFFVIVLGPAW